MIHTYVYNGLTWVDTESPSSAEISDLIKKYNIAASIGEELASPHSEPHVQLHKNCVFLTLDIPCRIKNNHHSSIITKEVDFVVGKDFIITAKYDTIEPLHNFSRVFETNSILDKNNDKKGIGEHAGFIFYYMLKKIYAHIERDLSNIKQSLKQAENRIFAGGEKEMVVELSRIGREIIDAKQVLRTHREVLELSAIAFEKMFSPNFRYQTDDIRAEYEKVVGSVENTYELLAELRDTNDSLLSSKQNETMKILTMMAFVTFPLSLFTEIFSMNTSHTPILGSQYDFEIILVIMVVGAGAMFSFFKYRKWL